MHSTLNLDYKDSRFFCCWWAATAAVGRVCFGIRIGSEHGALLFALVPPTPPCHLHAIPTVFKRVHGRPHVQQGEFVVFKHLSPVVIVNDIAYFFSTTINDPVMSIEWQFIPGKLKEIRTVRNLKFKKWSSFHYPISCLMRALGE